MLNPVGIAKAQGSIVETFPRAYATASILILSDRTTLGSVLLFTR